MRIHSDMKKYVSITAVITLILLACAGSDMIIKGCATGIYLWYSAVVPVILPFMLITSLAVSTLDRASLSHRSACVAALVVGVLCGFPTGTMILTAFCEKRLISREISQLLLPLCNNASAMFLYGYIYLQFLKPYLSLAELLCLLYIPQLIYTAAAAAITYTHGHALKQPTSDSKCRSNAVCPGMDKIITGISTIGVYMAIFSVLICAITTLLPYDTARAAAAFLEISQGISILSATHISPDIKTALSLSLTSFGGLSAIFQSHALIKEAELSFSKYIIGKCICGIICCICSLFYLS